MFYSHQLLARKAPLGQIWMAATLHAKMNRRKLDSLNIIQICEEILNPSVPMALRLSGILMGGVVIVYERKVKLLYDDVNRLLVELNEAWKVNAAPSDPTRLPKNKAQAKHGAVTLPKSRVEDLGDIEQSLQYSNATTIMGFQQTSYDAMRLDSVDDAYFNQNPQDGLNHDHHQVDAANITLFEDDISHQADTNRFNRFERFDIEGDDDFIPPEHTEIPSSLIPSPPPHDEPMKNDEIQEEHPEEQAKQHSDESKEAKPHSEESKEAKKGQMRKRPTRKIRRRPLVMDDNQNIIPGHIYQTWIRNPSDILAGRGRKRKTPMDPLSTMKISTLMDVPSMVVFERLFTSTNKVYYPPSLLELWMRITQPPHDSPSGRTSPPQPPEPSSSLSPPERMRFIDHPVQDHFDDHYQGQGFQSDRISVEKQRANANNNEPPETLMEELRNNLKNNGISGSTANLMSTPANSGDDGIRSIPSSGSGNGFLPHNSDANSGRSSKKRPFSASKNSGNNLEPVAEEFSWQHADPSFKLAKLSENETPYDDLIETGPTQTQKLPVVNQPLDHITDSIRMHLKTHFDTPGSANAESLNHLSSGMNRKRAACLFYQTCVLATRDYVKVEQIAPYGDILISRGAKI